MEFMMESGSKVVCGFETGVRSDGAGSAAGV